MDPQVCSRKCIGKIHLRATPVLDFHIIAELSRALAGHHG